MNIQDKIQKLHSKYGTTEMCNYKIQLFIEDLIKKDRAEQLSIADVGKTLHLDKKTYTEDDVEKAYKKGQNNDTYRLKNGTVILPNNYEGVDG